MGQDKFQHPSTRIKSTTSNLLEGKRIALGITGSVAAFRSPEIARELMRHGADVIPIMSREGEKMVGKNLMWWATGNEPITDVTGDLEHISMAGVMNEPVDLMLIAPSTTNTVAKIAAGVADTSVTLITSSLNGKGIPIMILCVAHIDLINSPPIQNALNQLRNWGITIIEPVISEGKAKVPKTQDVVYEVLQRISTKSLKDTSIIITGGPTREYIDNVRFITNSSSGKMGIELAKIAALRSDDTFLILGPTQLSVPRAIQTTSIQSTEQMTKKVINKLEENPESIVILSAAMADFTTKTKRSGKTKSGKDLTLELTSTEKLSDRIKKEFPKSKLVLFKAEWDVSEEELLERAIEKLQKCDADFIIANDLSRPGAGFETETNKVLIINKSGDYEEIKNTKFNLANIIIERLIDNFTDHSN